MVGRGKTRHAKTYYKTHHGKKNIVELVFPLQMYDDGGTVEQGVFSHPFTLQVPTWLHPSLLVKSGFEDGRLATCYFLRAQVNPTSEQDMMSDKESRFSSEMREIYITKPEF